VIPPGIAAVEHGADDESAPLVVLVHGAPDQAKSFTRTVRLLGDLSVIVYDRRGYGESVYAKPAASCLGDHVDDLLSLIDGRRATLIGHSFGSTVAVLAAIAAPEQVASLGLWEPPLPWVYWWPDHATKALISIGSESNTDMVGERAFKAVVGHGVWDRLPEHTKAIRRAEGATFQIDIASQLSAPFDFDDIKVPCLVGRGAASWDHFRDASQYLAQRIHGQLLDLDHAGHMAHVTHPEAFARFVRDAVALRAMAEL
jgi:pimeloyl-ACP methyl ester carboxylesterase